jgi:DNA primase catalytic core
MSNITDWIKTELYPTLYESIDTALPEHEFKRYSGGWRSKTYLTGATHKDRVDKTVITKQAPGYILEQGGDTLSLVDYIMRRDNLEFIQAVETLAKAVGLQLPKGEIDFNIYQRDKDQVTLLESCNSYFIYCLENSTGADEVKAYLSSRGYSDTDIKTMELGYIPDQDKLFKYLLSKGYSQTLIDEVVKLNKGIGTTHKLTIPYRSGGSIKGFKFRTVGEATPKYLNSTGLDRLGGFFNLLGIKGDKDLVVVEGELDSLSATARGVNNIVATGGSSISSDQVGDAIKRGAKSFSLCLDTEPDKEEETAKRINSAIEVILGEGVNRVYIVSLPDLRGGKTDPDRLIKESGVDAFKDAIRGALPYYEYKLQQLLNKYAKIEDEVGLQPKDIDRLLDEVVGISCNIPEPTDRDRFKKLFTSLDAIKELGITEESLSITVDRLTSSKNKELRDKELKTLLSEATQLQTKGDTDKALELLNNGIKETISKGAIDLLPPPMNFNTLLDEIATLPPAYKTGYSSLDKFVGFTPGAITLIAGRPSHGKTTFMFNLLLEMSKFYKEEKFYFFTYEEPVKNISIKLLNRLIATDLSQYYSQVKDLKPTNYEFLKSYIKARRTDIQAVEEGKRELQQLIDSQRITIIDKNYSVEELYNLILYLNKKERIGGVFIDYIQRMRTDKKTQDKRTEIAHISDQVLQIAKDSGLPLILGAQLNRDAKAKPTLENLKEAGNLEEDANTVLSVYNESREKDENSEGESLKGAREVELEIKALKNREGEPNQTATLIFDKYTGLIKEKDSSSKETYFK